MPNICYEAILTGTLLITNPNNISETENGLLIKTPQQYILSDDKTIEQYCLKSKVSEKEDMRSLYKKID